jgi:hypothetical protein
MDAWSHWEHGPDNNPVSTDSVIKAPYRTQWLGAPLFGHAGHHDGGRRTHLHGLGSHRTPPTRRTLAQHAAGEKRLQRRPPMVAQAAGRLPGPSLGLRRDGRLFLSDRQRWVLAAGPRNRPPDRPHPRPRSRRRMEVYRPAEWVSTPWSARSRIPPS